ncbi:MAG: hypothetical protein WHX93_16940 [bacterium]
MKATSVWVVGLFFFLTCSQNAHTQEQCTKAEEFAANALSHAKRLYNVDSMDEARLYAQNLLKASQDTLKAASRCGCADAEAYAEETLKYARKALQASGLEEVRIEAENAMGSAEDALKAAVACGD